MMALTALIICPVVANSEVIEAGVGVGVGIDVSVGIVSEAEVAVTLAEGEASDGVISVLGVEVLVGVSIGKVTDIVGDGDRAASVVVDGDEAAGA